MQITGADDRATALPGTILVRIYTPELRCAGVTVWCEDRCVATRAFCLTSIDTGKVV
jgi:hypothetical protein